MGYFKEIIDGSKSLIAGMRITIKRLFQPVVTVQYPRRRITMTEAFRGPIELRHFRDTNSHKCIACGTCEKMCPANVIKLQGVKGEAKGQKVLTHYVIDFSRCSLCGLCVECCPTKTLQYSTQYEMAGDSRSDSVIDVKAKYGEKPHH